MLALAHHHPLLTAITAGIVVSVVVGVLLKRVDDWFEQRRWFRRLKAFDAKIEAIARDVGRG